MLRAINPPQRLHLDRNRGIARLQARVSSEAQLDRVSEVVLETVTVRARGFVIDNFYLALVVDGEELRLPVGGGQLHGTGEGEASLRIAERVAAFLGRPLSRRER